MKLSVLKIENMVIFAFIHIVSSRAYHNVYKYRTSLTWNYYVDPKSMLYVGGLGMSLCSKYSFCGHLQLGSVLHCSKLCKI